jgi:hypothetical protein
VLLAAALLAGGVAAGCSTTNTGGTSSTTVSAKTDLHNAAQKLTSTSSKLNMQVAADTGGGSTASPNPGTTGVTTTINLSGSLDPVGGKSDLNVTVASVALEFRMLPDALYAKFAGGSLLPGLPAGWMKLDRTRLPNSLNDSLKPDGAMGVDRLIDAIDTASKSGNDYSGTIDLGKAAGSLGLPSALVSQIPESDRLVPFSASIDGQGFLTKMSFTPKIAGKTATTTMMFSNFGDPVDVATPPANEVTDAPDLIYTALSAIG